MDYNTQYEVPVYETPYHHAQPELKHSGMGIASFILSLVAGLDIFATFVVATVIAARSESEIDDESPEAIILGLFVCSGAAMVLVGLGLGIAGAWQANRKKIFAILGVIFNSVIATIVFGLMALGIAMGP